MADSSSTPPRPPDIGSVRSRIAALLGRGVFKEKAGASGTGGPGGAAGGSGAAAKGSSQLARREALERATMNWHRDPMQRGRLAELHEETAGFKISDASRLSPGEVFNLLAPALDRHLKRLGHFKPAPPALAKPETPASLIEAEAAPAEAEPPPKEEAPPPRDWVEFQFVDMNDQPVSGIKYKVKLPGGKVVEGKTASKGLLYFDDLDSGDCELEIVEFEAKG